MQTSAFILLNRAEAMKYSPLEMMDEVYRAVDEANATAPQHSRVVMELIDVLPLGYPDFPRTESKGNVIRRQAEVMLGSRVDRLYERYEKGTLGEGRKADDSAAQTSSLEEFLCTSAARIIGLGGNVFAESHDLSTSLFEVGLDSLGATQLRNELARFLHEDIPRDIVFQHSSINDLVAYSKTLDAVPAKLAHDIQLKKAEGLLTKYLSRLSTLNPVTESKQPEGRTVLLTGATGALGTEILRSLLSLQNITKIYSLHRGPDGIDREVKAFSSRLKDVDVLQRAAGEGRLQGLSASASDDELGVGGDMYQIMTREVTDIIDAAWPVNWSFPLEGFDKTINGVLNLVKLSTTQHPKTLHFISSIAAYANPSGPTIPETPVPLTPTVAMQMGYGLSKWVAERLLTEASKSLGVKVNIYRCGQLSGDTRNGAWNKTDFWAEVMASGINLGEIPDVGGVVDWIPVDVAANVILELGGISNAKSGNAGTDSATRTEAPVEVYHIANPSVATFEQISETLSTILRRPIRVVPTTAWLARLSSTPNPAITQQMVPVMEKMLKEEMGKMARMEVAKTCARSEIVKGCVGVADERYWGVVVDGFVRMEMVHGWEE